MKVHITLFIGLFFAVFTFAQDNVFLQREYWKGNPSVADVEKAIAEGNDITELNRNLFDGVCYAFLEQVDNKTIKHLLTKKGNEVDKITHDGRTYMFWAAYKGNLKMMQYLSDKGAKSDIEDAHGYTVLNFAANAGQSDPQLYDFLMSHDANIKATTHSGANALLLVSSAAQNVDIIEYFMDKGLAFDSVDDNDNGIFQYAAKGGNLKLLKTLVNKGADVKRINNNGENATFMAALGTRGKQNGKAVFEYLEGLGLAMDLVNKDGKNLLHLVSSRNNNEEVFQYLMDKGLDVNLQDAKGSTPLINASRGNSLEVIQLLASSAKDINVLDAQGRSALALAVSRNKPEVVEYLLDNGAAVAVADKKGNTLAYYLMESYNTKQPEAFEAKLQLLQDAGLAMTVPQHDGNTLLHLAAKENNLPLLKRLTPFGIAINQKNDEGNTALHLAAMSTKNAEILKYLIGQGADVALKTNFEETVYDLAKENELLQQQVSQLDFLKL